MSRPVLLPTFQGIASDVAEHSALATVELLRFARQGNVNGSAYPFEVCDPVALLASALAAAATIEASLFPSETTAERDRREACRQIAATCGRFLHDQGDTSAQRAKQASEKGPRP